MYVYPGNPDQTDHDYYLKAEWKDDKGNAVSTSRLLTDVFAGNYKFYVTSKGGCVDSSRLFTLVNQAGL